MTHLEHYALRWELDHTFWLWAKGYADTYDRGTLLRLMDRTALVARQAIADGETRAGIFERVKAAFMEECRISLHQRKEGWRREFGLRATKKPVRRRAVR